MRSMTSPARWSSLQMSARMARTSSRSGGLLCSNSSAASALRRMAPSGWFNSCARPEASWAMLDKRPTWASSARSRSISTSSRLRAVMSMHTPSMRTARVPRRPLHSPARGNPPLPAIGQHDTVLGRVVRRLVQRPLQCLPCGLSILGMHVLEERDHRDGLAGREAEHRVEPLGGPHRVLRSGPDPEAEVGRIRDQGHLLLALAQVIRDPRRPEHVVAQLVAHRRDQAQVEQGRREGLLDDSPQHQDGFERRSHREERDASAHHQRLPPVTPPPGRDRRVRDEHGEQQQTQLTDRHPGIGHALGDDGDGVTEEPNMSQRGDLQVAQVRRRTEVEQQVTASCTPQTVQASHSRPARK